MPATILALFDLDHTLLSGDSDQLWFDFLLQRGLLATGFAARNEELCRRYAEGTAGAAEFCNFYAATLAGRSAAQWAPLRAEFAAQQLLPRIPESARRLVERHRAQGHRLLLTSATNRFLVEPCAAELGFTELLATELAVDAEGLFTGATAGVLNMREGKLQRLHEWLCAQDLEPRRALAGACFYSDSINDLPLLSAVGHPVVVDPDAKLARSARAHGWPVLMLQR